MKKVFFNNFLISLLCLALGLAFVIWPDQILSASAKIIASVMLIAATINIVLYAFSNQERSGADIFYILISMIMIGMAISIFIRPTWIITSLSIIIGIVLILNSVGQISSVLLQRQYLQNWGYYLIVPFIAIIAGFLLVINSTTLATLLMRVTGISLIVNAISTFVIMHKLRKLSDKMEKMEKMEKENQEQSIIEIKEEKE